MNASKFRFTLDLQKIQSQISIPITLGDTARTWYISFSDGCFPYTIENGSLAKIEIKRPTGTYIEEFCPIEGNTTVIYSFSQNENTATVEGIHECMIVIYGIDGGIVASPRFSMIVSDRVINSDDIDFSDDNKTAVDAIMTAEAARQLAETERQSAETARQEAENGRVSAENARSKAEQARNTKFSDYKKAIDDAIAKKDMTPYDLAVKNGFQGTEKEWLESLVATVQIDETLSISNAAADSKATGDKISTIESQIADLLYVPIAIDSFSNSVGTVEKGSSVNEITFSWKLNKTPQALVLNETALMAEWNSITIYESVSDNRTYTLRATDERGKTATKTTSISFLNGVYYGVSAIPETLDSAFVLGLKKTLRSNKLPSFSVNAGAGQYIYYCLPTRFGTCTFTVGGFTGGFSLIDTIAFTNASGYKENYYVYRSDNASLGSTSVTVG